MGFEREVGIGSCCWNISGRQLFVVPWMDPCGRGHGVCADGVYSFLAIMFPAVGVDEAG